MNNMAPVNSVNLPTHVYVAFFVSFATCLLIVVTKHWHGSFSLDESHGIQKIHKVVTPRIGGLGIFFALYCSYFYSESQDYTILGSLIFSGFFAFIFGFAEDLTKRINITTRLFATFFAGIIGWSISSVSLTHVNIYILDLALKNQIIAVLFTAFAIGGIANAINILDGLNGLASSMIIISLVAISLIAISVGDKNLFIAAATVAMGVLGFFVINWPWGKIFLGDGGSYFCGFALAWSCVLLVERNPSISPFCGLLLCIYPFTEALFSIYRRKLKLKNSTAPDIQHLHSLIFRRYFSNKIRLTHTLNNSFCGILVGLMALPPAFCAFYFKEDDMACKFLVLFFIFAYFLAYRRVIKFKWI